MSDERDELAAVIERSYDLNEGMVTFELLAHATLAAGYRKPRVITTIEELDALPFESVIRDGDECVLERWGDMEESGWVTVMVTSFVPRDQITLPATVLYSPKEA